MAVGCHYFPPDTRLTLQPQSIPSLASTKLYCVMTEAHVCEQLAESRQMKVKLPLVKTATFQPISSIIIIFFVICDNYTVESFHWCYCTRGSTVKLKLKVAYEKEKYNYFNLLRLFSVLLTRKF